MIALVVVHFEASSNNIKNCSNCSSNSDNTNLNSEPNLNNKELCHISITSKKTWEKTFSVQYFVKQAAIRGLDCGIDEKNPYFEMINTLKNSKSFKALPNYWCENNDNESMPVPAAKGKSSHDKCPGRRFSVINKIQAYERFKKFNLIF